MLPLNKTSPTPCWLAIRLPHLSLDLLTRGQRCSQMPLAITGTLDRRDRIIDCNPAALSGGVKPGMPLAAALGILDTLQATERDRQAEQQALQRLAAWCYQYSNQVVIPSARSGLFLEAGASERLFGPPEALSRRMEEKLVQLGYHAMTGTAPTPEAAWLAASGAQHIPSSGHIRKQLASLPLNHLHLDAAQVLSMERMGFRRLHDLLRLPRKALNRRFGPSLSDYLDRLLGIRPDLRPVYQPPENYSAQMELPAEIQASQALLFPLRRMVEELCGVLRGGDNAVQSLRITLTHEDHPDSLLEPGLQSPSQDPARLMIVLRERTERLRLPQAVRSIHLEVPRLLKLDAGQHTLFRDTPAEQQQDIEHLAERLQARLGDSAVSGITGVEDHRPEYSWRRRPLHEPPECASLAHRPAWLFPRPRRCRIENYEILAGPERIESGWWDGRDCRRDYFIVRDAHGSTLWAFHEYKPRRGWYLHGIFA